MKKLHPGLILPPAQAKKVDTHVIEPGSLIWIKTYDEEINLFAGMNEKHARMLLDQYRFFVTAPDVQIQDLDADDLENLGLIRTDDPRIVRLLRLEQHLSKMLAEMAEEELEEQNEPEVQSSGASPNGQGDSPEPEPRGGRGSIPLVPTH